MAGRSRILGFGLPLAGLAALIAGGTTVMRDQPRRPVEQPATMPPISPSAAGVSDAREFIGATGAVEAAGRNIEIASQVAGVVARVDVRVGQPITAGDPLFTVESRDAEAAVAQRRSDLVLAEARVGELLSTIPSSRAHVQAAAANTLAARAAVDRARGDLICATVELSDRENLLRIAQSAYESDARAISAETLETRRFGVRAAAAGVSAANAWVAQNEAQVAQAVASEHEAQATLGTLIDDSTGAEGPVILSARAAVDQARSSLQAALTLLELRTVRSPITGRILQVQVRPGHFAPAGVAAAPLIILGPVDPLHVRVQIDEADLPRFSPAARAWASPRGNADRRLELALDTVEPMVVPKRRLTGSTSERVDTRVLEVVYALPLGTDRVFVGQQLDVYVEVIGNDQPAAPQTTPAVNTSSTTTPIAHPEAPR